MKEDAERDSLYSDNLIVPPPKICRPFHLPHLNSGLRYPTPGPADLPSERDRILLATFSLGTTVSDSRFTRSDADLIVQSFVVLRNKLVWNSVQHWRGQQSCWLSLDASLEAS